MRDLNYLIRLKAIGVSVLEEDYLISVRLAWATEVTETAFYKEIKKLPEARTRLILEP